MMICDCKYSHVDSSRNVLCAAFPKKLGLEFWCGNDENFLGGGATQNSFCTFSEIPVGVTVKVASIQFTV